MTELAVNHVWRAHYEEVHQWAERAITAARRLEDAALIAAALAVGVLADSMMGAAERAEANRREATAIVDSLSDDELARYLEAPARLAGTELYLGRYADGEVHATRALAVARATGQGELVLVLVATLGGLWRMRGKLAEAGELLDGGIEAARLFGNAHALVWTLLGRSAAALHAGDVELALATAQEGFDLSANLDEGFHSAEAAVDLARALIESGEPQRAVELLLESAGGEDLVLIARGPRAHYLESLARCWLALDRPADAQRAAKAARLGPRRYSSRWLSLWANRATAAVELAHRGRRRSRPSARSPRRSSSTRWGAPVGAALSRTLAGRALAQAGERERASTELQHAAHAFERCGAVRYRDEAEHELRKLGHRIHRRTRPGKIDGTGIESLTERELQVARLVVDRKTIRRSPQSSSSARRQSRRTCATSSASSTSRHESP